MTALFYRNEKIEHFRTQLRNYRILRHFQRKRVLVRRLLINTKPEDFNADLKQAYVNFSEQGIFLLKKEK